MWKNVVSTAAVIVGCVVGAGFASGREMIIFFGENCESAIFIAIGFFVLFALVVVLFLHNGKKFAPNSLTDLNRHVFGKCSKCFDLIFLINYFLVMATMLAGCQAVFNKMMAYNGFPLFSLLIAVICAVIIFSGLNGIKKASLILAPITVFFILFVTISSTDGFAVEVENLDFVFQTGKYVAYNSMLMCGVLTACGKTLKKKEILLSAVFSSLILAVMIFFITNSFVGKSFVGIEMPLLYLAKKTGIGYWAFSIVMLVSIMTTLLSSAHPLVEWGETKTKDKTIAVVAVFGVAFVVSMFGFASIMDFAVPIVSVVSVIFLVQSTVTAVRRRAKIGAPLYNNHHSKK